MQQALFDVEQYSVIPDDWSQDDWETPTDIARKMAALVCAGEVVLEPAAGRGAIVRELCKVTPWCAAVEAKTTRAEDGRILAPKAVWICANFLKLNPDIEDLVDVVITNPPFSQGLEFIHHSLKFLNLSNPNARLLYLLPGDYFCSQERNDAFEALDCHIAHRYRIRGRVGYIQEGIQQNNRQCYDAVFCIKPGKAGATETVL